MNSEIQISFSRGTKDKVHYNIFNDQSQHQVKALNFLL